jgi:hypothetical protein
VTTTTLPWNFGIEILLQAGLELELVDIVLREPERIPQHDHVLQRERKTAPVNLGTMKIMLCPPLWPYDDTP